MSNKPRSVCKSLLEIFKKLRVDRAALILEVCKRRVRLEAQAAIINEYKKMENSYRNLVTELREVQKESREMAEMATRHRNIVRAANAEREDAPLQ
jgi:hypothetical protein